MGLKETIHELVDTCEDESVLYNTLETLQNSVSVKDWWDELTEAEKEKTLISLQQSANGQTISHEVVMQKVKFNLRN